MSYRDLRNLTEMLRSLGYPRLVSMENFRHPNFPLVAELLLWLAKRFDSQPDLHDKTDTEEDRILLIRSIAHFMALKANVMLNTKRLYQADGYAVKELLKITSLLYNALKQEEEPGEEQRHQAVLAELADIGAKINEVKMSRELASLVTKRGAALHQLLGKEVELREARTGALVRQLELSSVEERLKEAIRSKEEALNSAKSSIENVAITEATLDQRIEKRQAELERNQKRLLTLTKVRPGFVEELETLESELETLYEQYATRMRLVAHLEARHEEAAQAQAQAIANRQRETRRAMEEQHQEDARRLAEEEEEEEEKRTRPEPVRRLRTATALRGRLGTGKKRVVGGMAADDEDDDSLDSDSDLLVDYEDQEDDDSLPPAELDQQLSTDDDDF